MSTHLTGFLTEPGTPFNSLICQLLRMLDVYRSIFYYIKGDSYTSDAYNKKLCTTIHGVVIQYAFLLVGNNQDDKSLSSVILCSVLSFSFTFVVQGRAHDVHTSRASRSVKPVCFSRASTRAYHGEGVSTNHTLIDDL